ncbi:MAG: ATP-binding protein [Saprospiraceae bacterium]
MNRFISVWILLLLPICCFSKSTTAIDSLKTILKSTTIDDSTTIVNTIQLTKIYLASEPVDYDAAIEVLEKSALMVNEMTTSNQLIGRYFSLLGNAYYTKNSYSGGDPKSKEKSPFYYKKSIPYLSAVNDSIELAEALLNCGTMIMYTEKGTALNYFQKAAKLFEVQNNIDRQVSTYTQLCTVLAAIGQVDKALIYSRKALDKMPQIEDYYTVAQSCIGIGIVYLDAKKYKYAEDMFQEAYKAAIRGKDDFLIACTQMYLAANRVDKEETTAKELAEAKTQLDEATVLFTKLENEYVLQYLNMYYASYYLKKNDFQSALNRTNTYEQYISGLNITDALAMVYLKKGYIFEQMNTSDSAYHYYNACLDLSKKSDNNISIKGTYEHLYELAKKEKDFEAALKYHEQYLMYHDSIYNNQLQDIMGTEGVRLDIESEKKARKNAELQAQLLTSRNQLFGAIALGLLAIILVGSYLFRQLQKARKQLESQNLQLTQLNETKDKFFGIIAHDIRSPIMALDSVGEQMNYYLSKNNEKKLRRLADRVDTTAKRLTNLLDNLLNWALLQTGMIPYHPKSVNLKSVSNDIFELYEPVATTKKITLENNISTETTVYADERALNTIIRNLVNNALKFTPENGVIRVSEVVKNDKIFIEINDTGTGISAEKLPKLFALERTSTDGTAGEKGSGLGLMLCKELVELNKGTIKAISELGKGSTFIFSVPQLP